MQSNYRNKMFSPREGTIVCNNSKCNLFGKNFAYLSYYSDDIEICPKCGKKGVVVGKKNK